MSVVKPISLGQVVESTMGRDLHTRYLVVGILGGFVLAANGRERMIKNPKKKNTRHVKTYKRVFPLIAEKLESGRTISDEEIRGVLNSYKPDNL